MPKVKTAIPGHSNLELFGSEIARAALIEITDQCMAFATRIPASEDAQAAEIERIVTLAGQAVRDGAFHSLKLPQSTPEVIRLYKEKAGRGRVKIQLFPLTSGESHPPHAHYNLVSCQVVMRGQVRMREYSLIRRLPGDVLEIAEQPEKTLFPGDGVITLQHRNNIHWQEGLEPDTLLLNINWQGYFDTNPMTAANAEHGRCYIDWDSARPGESPGRILVPEIQVEAV